MEVWRHVRCSDMDVWRHGALDAYCKCGDVEVSSCGGALHAQRRGGMERWRRAVGVAIWR